MRILIIDDEMVSRTKLELIMENFGNCKTVDHGAFDVLFVQVGGNASQPKGRHEIRHSGNVPPGRSGRVAQRVYEQYAIEIQLIHH